MRQLDAIPTGAAVKTKEKLLLLFLSNADGAEYGNEFWPAVHAEDQESEIHAANKCDDDVNNAEL